MSYLVCHIIRRLLIYVNILKKCAVEMFSDSTKCTLIKKHLGYVWIDTRAFFLHP